uniref:Transcription repressor n=1 Tax=Kalanchoe fedtschenkoi TaxID=63787 RepID=A0A7N0ZSC5_KALFE
MQKLRSSLPLCYVEVFARLTPCFPLSDSLDQRIKFHLNKVTVRLSCSCLKPRSSSTTKHQPASKDYSVAHAEAAASYYYESPNMKSAASVGDKFSRMGGDWLVEEIGSHDPYLDFKHSMLQMILVNEIYSRDDLAELLNCFLQLNVSYHYGFIIRAFTEILHEVFSVRPAAAMN